MNLLESYSALFDTFNKYKKAAETEEQKQEELKELEIPTRQKLIILKWTLILSAIVGLVLLIIKVVIPWIQDHVKLCIFIILIAVALFLFVLKRSQRN